MPKEQMQTFRIQATRWLQLDQCVAVLWPSGDGNGGEEVGNKEGRGGKQLHQVQNFKSWRRQRQVWTQLEGSAGDVAGSGSNSGLPW